MKSPIMNQLNNLNVILKLILVGFLIGSLSRQIYAYYQIANTTVFFCSIGIFVICLLQKKLVLLPVPLLIAIIFNPFVKLKGMRSADWQQIDRWVIAVMLVWTALDLFFLIGKDLTTSLRKK